MRRGTSHRRRSSVVLVLAAFIHVLGEAAIVIALTGLPLYMIAGDDPAVRRGLNLVVGGIAALLIARWLGLLRNIPLPWIFVRPIYMACAILLIAIGMRIVRGEFVPPTLQGVGMVAMVVGVGLLTLVRSRKRSQRRAALGPLV